MRAMALGLCLAMLGGIGMAQAQNQQGAQAATGMQDQKAPGMANEMDHRMPMMGGETGMPMMGGRMGMSMMHGRGAIFAFRSPRGGIFIRCAADESMRACADAAAMLMHEVANMGPESSRSSGAPGSSNGGAGTGAPGK